MLRGGLDSAEESAKLGRTDRARAEWANPIHITIAHYFKILYLYL